MKCFVQTDNFRKLNVGFCLDEGIASVKDEYAVYYAEKTIWCKHEKKIFNKYHLKELLFLFRCSFHYKWPNGTWILVA